MDPNRSSTNLPPPVKPPTAAPVSPQPTAIAQQPSPPPQPTQQALTGAVNTGYTSPNESTPPVPIAAQQAVSQPVTAGLTSSVVYFPAKFEKVDGQLIWGAKSITLVNVDNQQILDIPTETIQSVKSGGTILTVKTASKTHGFIFGGLGTNLLAVSSMVAAPGSLAGEAGVAKAIGQAGIEDWLLEARKYPHIKTSMTNQETNKAVAKWFAIGFCALIVAAAISSVLSS